LTALQLMVVVPVSYACAVEAVARPPATTARPREAAARARWARWRDTKKMLRTD
jgi:hypothetical protein